MWKHDFSSCWNIQTLPSGTLNTTCLKHVLSYPFSQVLPVIPPCSHFPDSKFQTHLWYSLFSSPCTMGSWWVPWKHLSKSSLLLLVATALLPRNLLSALSVPDCMQNTFYTLSHLILTAIQWGRPIVTLFYRWENRSLLLYAQITVLFSIAPWKYLESSHFWAIASHALCAFLLFSTHQNSSLFARPALAPTAGNDLSLNYSSVCTTPLVTLKHSLPIIFSPMCMSYLPN